jgi:hypothetical protein
MADETEVWRRACTYILTCSAYPIPHLIRLSPSRSPISIAPAFHPARIEPGQADESIYGGVEEQEGDGVDAHGHAGEMSLER